MQMDLLAKYNQAVPRYTSYPTVPHWNTSEFNTDRYSSELKSAFHKGQGEVSLYIHLPYCESLCTYCGCNKYITKNHLVERPYIQALLKEWRMYIKLLGAAPVLRELHLGGGTPSFFSPENLSFLLNELLRDAVLPARYNFSFEAHPDNTTQAHLEVLYAHGFRRLSLGIQDFHDEINQTINRQQKLEDIISLTHNARSIGYSSLNYDLIYGLPKQKLEHIQANMEHIRALKPDRIAYYSYAHVPTLKKAQRAYDEGDLAQGIDKLKLYEAGKEALLGMGYVDIGMDHFALPKDELTKSMRSRKLHRNFMGYTPFSTQLNLAIGASAIADSWTAYAQNEKDVRKYILKMREVDRLPVEKMHFNSESDREIRRHILNLMCQYSTHWLHGHCPVHETQWPALRQMEKDGLLKIFPQQLKVTELGKTYIRNICALLDERMHRSLEKKLFSQAV